MVSLLALTTRVPISREASHCPCCCCVTKLPWLVDPPAELTEPADVPAAGGDPAVEEPAADVAASGGAVADAAPDVPGAAELPPPGTIAGEPDVVECVPLAAGRSDEGAAVDCAKAGPANAVATRQAAMCLFSIRFSPEGYGGDCEPWRIEPNAAPMSFVPRCREPPRCPELAEHSAP
jgi:hypothetical protein